MPRDTSTRDTSPTTHDCPGGCGTPVARHRFACAPCWWRLPMPLRTAITETYQVDHVKHTLAMVEAMHWYRKQSQS